MPSNSPLTVFYETLSPRTVSADLFKSPVGFESEPNYERETVKSYEFISPSRTVTTGDKKTVPVPLVNGGIQVDRHRNRFARSNSSYNFSISMLPLSIDMEATKEVLITTVLSLWGLLLALVLALIPRRFRYKDVSGQIVLITGAGSGIGRLMAKKFALQHGAIVVVWDINKPGCEETVKDIRTAGGKCHGYIVDVSNKEKIYEAAEKVKAEVGKVDILINNAGIVSGSKFLDTSDAQIEKTFQVNSLSNFWTTKAFLPGMIKEDSGHIVTIASTAGLVGVNRLVDYCSSKFAAVGFHEALITELKSEMGQQGINATLVCPYYINTGMFDGVKSKLISILNPEDVVNDVVAGILTNQESVVIPRYILALVVAKFFVPAQVGMRVQAALGITGTMMTFKGRNEKK